MTRRLVAGYLALALVVLLALEVPLGVVYARTERQAFELRVERDATALASLAEDALTADAARPRLAALVARYARDTGARAVVVGPAGTALADSDPTRPLGRAFATRPEIAMALRGEVAVGERGSATLGGRIVYVAAPVVADGRVVGAVRISVPADRVDARVRRYWLVLGAIGIVVLAAVAGVGWVLARGIAGPLTRVGVAAGRMGDDTGARAPEDAGPPEVRALARRLNASTARIDALLAAQRAFVADASHQLRTPLTAVRLRLENLERDVGPEGRDDLAAALGETERLTALVDGLLALARADAAAGERERIDVSRVCADRAAAWEPLAEDAGLRLRAEVAPGLAARAAPGALEQILDNLIDNALRAAPPGSSVTVRARADGDAVTVAVADAGPGMTPEVRERALERFWTTRPGEGGTGLGLAVVDRLARAAGGGVRLGDRKGGGLLVEVRLPAADAPRTTGGRGDDGPTR
ncbi:MAG TPA: ATP-binding protein [Miltoncostaeaceae bacterium]|nr:ATP-binding protein [Miltoncostaeaceae bacterium]